MQQSNNQVYRNVLKRLVELLRLPTSGERQRWVVPAAFRYYNGELVLDAF